MKIILGFSTSATLFSKIIRFCTRSEVSHTYIRIYDDFFETSFVLEVERTMRILRSEEFDRDNVIVEEYEIDDERLDKSVKHNLKHLGKTFNWLDWFGWFPLIKKWAKTKIKSPTHSFKKMICVDFVLRVLNDADITHLPMGVLSPEILRQWTNEYFTKFGWKKTKGTIYNITSNKGNPHEQK